PVSCVLSPASRKRALSLPKPRSQSGRRLFVRNENELWLEIGGKFRCFGDGRELEIDPKFYRGEVPDGWDAGGYVLIRGSFARGRMELWLDGRRWLLERGSTIEWTLRSFSSASSPRSSSSPADGATPANRKSGPRTSASA